MLGTSHALWLHAETYRASQLALERVRTVYVNFANATPMFRLGLNILAMPVGLPLLKPKNDLDLSLITLFEYPQHENVLAAL